MPSSHRVYKPFIIFMAAMVVCTWLPGSDLGGGGGAKGAEAPPSPPLQVNEMRNIHFGQNTNSHLSETSEK